MSEVTASVGRTTSRPGRSGQLARGVAWFLLRNGMVLFLIALVIAVSIGEPTFLTKDNLQNLALQWAPVGLMAVAMTFVVIGGGFDLSVGGTYAMATVIYAEMAERGYPVGVGIVACLVAGALIGLLNGLIVTRARVNAFVATLGSGYIIGGLALVVTTGTPIGIQAPSYLRIGQGTLAGLPIPVWILIASFIVGGVALAKSIYGKQIYAVGGSAEASRLSGLRTNTLQTSTYLLTGLMAAIGGMIIAGQLGTGQGNAGTGIELMVITVVLAGGIAPSGGEGAMWRTLVGLAILATLGNAFDLLQISPFWQSVVTGAILIAALALDSLGKRLRPVSQAETNGLSVKSENEAPEDAFLEATEERRKLHDEQ